ncbi:hypothetical protein C3V36_04970 [Lachnospiraceae bacterium oral taxon 500]|nr:hypothetical protein C3V36_04970 [Lachnospiraceae bacterium oral taxon 500]
MPNPPAAEGRSRTPDQEYKRQLGIIPYRQKLNIFGIKYAGILAWPFRHSRLHRLPPQAKMKIYRQGAAICGFSVKEDLSNAGGQIPDAGGRWSFSRDAENGVGGGFIAKAERRKDGKNKKQQDDDRSEV